MRRSLVGFESPNFGHAFLDGFEDLYNNNNREREEYGDLDEELNNTSFPRLATTSTPTFTSTVSSASNNNTRAGGNSDTRSRPRGVALGGENYPLSRSSPGVLGGLRVMTDKINNGTTNNNTDNKNNTNNYTTNNNNSSLSQFNDDPNSEDIPEPSLDDLLVFSPPEWTLCCVCHEIFKQPTSTLCGHSFCYDCIVEVINRKGTCPLCRHPIGFNEITENKQAMQAISGLMVRCKYGLCLVSPPSRPIVSSSFSTPFPLDSSSSPLVPSPPGPSSFPIYTTADTSTSTTPHARTGSTPITIRIPPSFSTQGPPQARSLPSSLPSFMRTAAEWCISLSGCTATFPLSQQASHEANCPHRPIVCYNDGCKEKIKTKDLEAHMESCSYRVTQCPDCKEMLLLSEEESHSQICPEKEVGCPFKCPQRVRRKEKDDHLSVCTHMEVSCKHAQYGCSFRGLRVDHEDHLVSCLYKGLASVLGGMTQEIAQLTLANQNQAHTISMLQQEIKSLQTHVREQAAEIRSLREASSHRFMRDPFE